MIFQKSQTLAYLTKDTPKLIKNWIRPSDFFVGTFQLKSIVELKKLIYEVNCSIEKTHL
jgi:hypothetical protein